MTTIRSWYAHFLCTHYADFRQAQLMQALSRMFGWRGRRLENCRCGGWILSEGNQ